MPRIDGLPAADALTGSEPFAMMQGGVTKSATPEQLLAFFRANISLDGSGNPSTSGPTLVAVEMNEQGHLIFTRSDGVTLDLPPAGGAAGTGVGFTLRGGWVAATSYAVGDLVTYQGSSYVAVAAFTSTSTFNPSNWQLIAAAGTGGIVLDGVTLETNSAGKVAVVGATPDSLTAADPTKVGAGTLVITVNGVDQKTTGAALIAGQGATPDSLAPAAAAALGAGTLVVTIGGVDEKTTGAALVASQETPINALPPGPSPATLSDIIVPVFSISANKAVEYPLSQLLALGSSGSGSGSAGGTSGGTQGGTSTPANATTYAISTASTGTASTAQPVAVAVSGTLSSAVVVTLSDGAGGTFGGTVTLAAGTNPSGSTFYTPASAGTVTIIGNNNGGLTNPSGPSVTVAAAAASGGGSTTSTHPAFVFSNGANTFDTTAPANGAAAWNSQKNGQVTLNLGSDNAAVCVEFEVRGAKGESDTTGSWINLFDGTKNIGLGTEGTTVRPLADDGSSHGFSGNMYDDAWHPAALNYDPSSKALSTFLDGQRTGVVSGINFSGGTSVVLTMYGSCGPNGTGIDDVKVSNVSKYTGGSYTPSTGAAVRDANTVVIYNWDKQDGTGS